MPRIFDLNLVGVLVASIAFYFVGFLFYGILFTDVWMSGNGVDLWLQSKNMTAEEFQATESSLWMVGGFLITILQVIGIGKVLQWRSIASVPGAIATAALIWFLFALPFVHYSYLYLPAHSVATLLVDGCHLLVGWVVSAIVLQLLR